MTTKEMMAVIGTNAVITMEKIKIEVEVMDARQNFGRTEYLVKPLAGAGEQWVEISRVC